MADASNPTRATQARLVSLQGFADIVVDRALLVIGRHRGCDVRLDSSTISRRHCCLACDAGDIVVRDLGSTNGTCINGTRVDEGRLRLGDQLAIGRFTFVYVSLLDDKQARTTCVDRPPTSM